MTAELLAALMRRYGWTPAEIERLPADLLAWLAASP